MASRDAWLRWAKPLLFIALALPLTLTLLDVARELQSPGSGLGPDPADELTRRLGAWSLRVLLLTLAVSPLSRLLKRLVLIRFRRMIGLWAFAYMVMHFTVYFVLLAGFDPLAAVGDVTKRPYITVGFAALLSLVPLAVTSTRGWQRRLGRRWRALHGLVYPAAVAAWTHLVWLSKGSFMDPFVYGVVLALLFGERIAFRMRRGRRREPARGRSRCAGRKGN